MAHALEVCHPTNKILELPRQPCSCAFFCHSPQAGESNDFIVTLPSDGLDQGSTHLFGLRVTTALSVWGEARVEVFKASDDLQALKVSHMCAA